jgi:hypothetical protein
LIHTGIDEQQCWILRRNQRRAFDNCVSAVREEFKKSPANLVTVQVFLFPLVWHPHRIQDEPKP